MILKPRRASSLAKPSPIPDVAPVMQAQTGRFGFEYLALRFLEGRRQ